MAIRLKSILTCIGLCLGCATSEGVTLQKNEAALIPTYAKIRFQEAQPQSVDSSIIAEVAIETELAPLRAEMEVFTQRVVGRLKSPLVRGKPESTMGNFVSDAMRSHVKRTVGTEPDFCFTNLGGLRIDLPMGDVTAGQVTELMPFDNNIVTFRSAGTQTQQLLSRIAQRGDPVSGLTYRLPGNSFEVNGVPVRDDQTYLVCTNDYVFDGGGNYPINKKTLATYTGELLRDAIEQAFLNQSGISVPAIGSRVRPLKEVP
jgi:2',3'-cyclic-nucleotide 2'-phosphodiesterase (5'-nucleotidase family)